MVPARVIQGSVFEVSRSLVLGFIVCCSKAVGPHKDPYLEVYLRVC